MNTAHYEDQCAHSPMVLLCSLAGKGRCMHPVSTVVFNIVISSVSAFSGSSFALP